MLHIVETFNADLVTAYQTTIRSHDEGPGADRPVFTLVGELEFERFQKKMRALRNRAHRLGVAQPSFEVAARGEDKFGARVLLVHIKPALVRLDGWRFVASLQHTKHGTIVRRAPGTDDVVIPSEWLSAKPVCDHCNTRRTRKDTFVVSHDGDGRVMRVGRSCLADFVGSADGSAIGRFMASSFNVGEEDWLGNPSPSRNLLDYVTTVKVVIDSAGWMPASKARNEGEVPTWRLARTALADLGARGLPAEARVTASAAVEWARSLPTDSTGYLNNLRVACSFQHVTEREMGIVASVIAAHQRHLEREEAARREATLPPLGASFFGAVGDKIGRKLTRADRDAGKSSHPALRVTVVGVKSFDGEYGTRSLVTMERTTPSERLVLIWWTGATTAKIGTEYVLQGSVKDHKVYREVCQTVLTRCKLIAVE